MDTLQDLLTTIAIFLEYLIFGYLAVAFILYSFKRQASETNGLEDLSPPRQKPSIVSPPEENLLLVPVG
ncbi:MAG: hypothetical protein WCA35_29360 [Kovacikia sp.]